MHRESIQEAEYQFPYHHIPQIKPFSPARVLSWSHEYVSYIEAIIEKLSGRTFSSLVDIGCGDGRLLAELQRRFDVKFTGTDFSNQALRFAKAFAPKASFYEDFPEGEKFDAFTLIEVLEHIPPNEINSFLKKLSSHMRPESFGVITVPSVREPLNRKHYQHFSASHLVEILAPYFITESVTHLNARCLGESIVRRIFSNRFFVLNHRGALSFLYRLYTKRYLYAQEGVGARLMAVVRPTERS